MPKNNISTAASEASAGAEPHPELEISPPHLNVTERMRLFLAREELANWEASGEYRGPLAELVRHARHLTPKDHALLAALILQGFRRRAGRPRLDGRREEIDNTYLSELAADISPARTTKAKIAEIAKTYGHSRETARGLYRERRKVRGNKQSGGGG